MSTFVSEWFEEMVTWFREPTRAAELIEVLSDTSNEWYVNALTARHLRAYGQQRDHDFWVRSEWSGTDISYGSIVSPFLHWDRAWWNGQTGDLGQTEVKALYTHYARSQVSDRISRLAAQLYERRKNDVASKCAKFASRQAYHGLVWIHRHGSPNDECSTSDLQTLMALVDEELSPLTDFTWAGDSIHVARNNLGRLWPHLDREYVGDLWVRLLEYTARSG